MSVPVAGAFFRGGSVFGDGWVKDCVFRMIGRIGRVQQTGIVRIDTALDNHVRNGREPLHFRAVTIKTQLPFGLATDLDAQCKRRGCPGMTKGGVNSGLFFGHINVTAGSDRVCFHIGG